MLINFAIFILILIWVGIMLIPTKRKESNRVWGIDDILAEIEKRAKDGQKKSAHFFQQSAIIRVTQKLNDYQAAKILGKEHDHIRSVLSLISFYKISLPELGLSAIRIRLWWQQDSFEEAIRDYKLYLKWQKNWFLRFFSFMPREFFKADLDNLDMSETEFLMVYKMKNKGEMLCK